MTESSSVVTWGYEVAAGRRGRGYEGAHGALGCDRDFYDFDCGDSFRDKTLKFTVYCMSTIPQ